MMQLSACAVLLLVVGLSSGQIIFSVKSLSEPRAALLQLPVLTRPEGAAPFSAALDYKQQVEQRNGECYQQCATEFAMAEGSAKVCERGCRFFALSEAIKPKLDASEHRDKCIKDCGAAYTVMVEQHSCESGCRHQRPKAQDSAGAPVVMSVVRKFTFDSTGDQEVRRSQSSVLVRDGDAVRVIQGPTKLTVSRHEGGVGEPRSPFAGGPDASRVLARSGLLSFTADGGGVEEGSPAGMDGMMARMRDAVHRMMASFSDGQPPQQDTPELKSALGHPRDAARPRIAVGDIGRSPTNSSWHRVWRCTPHYVVLGALLLGTSMVLYGVYCLLAVMLRARRRQQALIQNEELAEADDLPPKYAVAVDTDEVKLSQPGDVPPAYTAIVAEAELPPKPQV